MSSTGSILSSATGFLSATGLSAEAAFSIFSGRTRLRPGELDRRRDVHLTESLSSDMPDPPKNLIQTANRMQSKNFRRSLITVSVIEWETFEGCFEVFLSGMSDLSPSPWQELCKITVIDRDIRRSKSSRSSCTDRFFHSMTLIGSL